MNSESTEVVLAWLGRRTSPRNYYELLGIREDASDLAIESAADELLAHLQQVPRREGSQLRRWKHLIAQIESARNCLTDTEERQRYDLRLQRAAAQAARGNHNPAQVPDVTGTDSKPDPMAPFRPSDLPRPPAESTDLPEIKASPWQNPAAPAIRSLTPPVRIRAKRKQSANARGMSTNTIYLAVGLCFAGVLGGFYALVQTHIRPRQAQRDAASPPRIQSAADLPLPPGTANATAMTDSARTVEPQASRSEPSRTTLPTARPRAAEPPPPIGIQSDSAVAPRMAEFQGDQRVLAAPRTNATSIRQLSSGEQAALDSQLRVIGLALRDGRLADATRALDEARNLAAGSNGANRTERFALLVDYVMQFWQAFDESISTLEGTELTLAEGPAYVVSARPDQLVVRMGGQNRRFDRGTLPPPVTLAIARRHFAVTAPSTAVFEAAFLLVQAPFAQEPVVRRLHLAATKGAQLDDFTKILDDWKTLGL